jgi:DNA processing protein
LADAGVRAAAIVGSRAASAYGERVTAELAYGLAGHGVVVVSGGAYGIDAAAHRAAMAGGGATIIVSAGGLDRPYPAGNAALFDRAAERGLVVSESPPGSAPHRHRFLSRNRLIAALSTGTVVVEAALRSGALNTAGHCILQGRPLMVVPGPVTSGLSAGCHALLRREDYAAILVESVDHVLAVVGSIGEGIDLAGATQRPPGDVLAAILDRLDPTARRVFDGLPARTAVSAAQLAARSGVSLIQVARAVPALQVAGLVEVSDGTYRISSVLRRSSRLNIR